MPSTAAQSSISSPGILPTTVRTKKSASLSTCTDCRTSSLALSRRRLAAGKNFLFSDRGEARLSGFEEPVRLYEVRWQEGSDEYAN
jgi:hypothetical protein